MKIKIGLCGFGNGIKSPNMILLAFYLRNCCISCKAIPRFGGGDSRRITKVFCSRVVVPLFVVLRRSCLLQISYSVIIPNMVSMVKFIRRKSPLYNSPNNPVFQIAFAVYSNPAITISLIQTAGSISNPNTAVAAWFRLPNQPGSISIKLKQPVQ